MQYFLFWQLVIKSCLFLTCAFCLEIQNSVNNILSWLFYPQPFNNTEHLKEKEQGLKVNMRGATEFTLIPSSCSCVSRFSTAVFILALWMRDGTLGPLISHWIYFVLFAFDQFNQFEMFATNGLDRLVDGRFSRVEVRRYLILVSGLWEDQMGWISLLSALCCLWGRFPLLG